MCDSDDGCLQTSGHRDKHLKPSAPLRRPWTPEEDAKLKVLVSRLGNWDWCMISSVMEGRSGKQCRERYKNHVSEKINKGPWTKEEDKIIMEAQARSGSSIP